jgi:hypothetical protein
LIYLAEHFGQHAPLSWSKISKRRATSLGRIHSQNSLPKPFHLGLIADLLACADTCSGSLSLYMVKSRIQFDSQFRSGCVCNHAFFDYPQILLAIRQSLFDRSN